MKWTYSIKNKLTAAVLLASILIVTLANNLVERSHFKQLDASFASMYEDRMLVESYIFQLYENLQKRQELITAANNELGFDHLKADLHLYKAQRNKLIEKYATTYLTDEEEVEFDKLKGTVKNINSVEDGLLNLSKSQDELSELISRDREKTSTAFETLSALSSIQTSEAKSIRAKSERIILGNISISQLEMAVLIIIGLVIQALIFSSKSMKPNINQKHQLN
jgi:activator of 2-hydroxyglutaryl-CoA dehydratase